MADAKRANHIPPLTKSPGTLFTTGALVLHIIFSNQTS